LQLRKFLLQLWHFFKSLVLRIAEHDASYLQKILAKVVLRVGWYDYKNMLVGGDGGHW